MACHTQEEIAEKVGLTQQQVQTISDGFTDSVLENQNCKTAANHATDFTIPIYNVWKQQMTNICTIQTRPLFINRIDQNIGNNRQGYPQILWKTRYVSREVSQKFWTHSEDYHMLNMTKPRSITATRL
jgi:DNA-binding XRE family transcriptional regulator